MHSLRASVVFIAIALFAFFADNGRMITSPAPEQQELAPAQAAADEPAPENPETLVAAKKKPSKKKSSKVTRIVRATAYNAVPQQTDSTPEICAWGDRIKPGIIAISYHVGREHSGRYGSGNISPIPTVSDDDPDFKNKWWDKHGVHPNTLIQNSPDQIGGQQRWMDTVVRFVRPSRP